MDSGSNQEYCPGYIDQHGIWNNGFYCPKWTGDGPGLDTYCCGTDDNRYCCPRPHLDNDSSESTTLIVGVSIFLSFFIFTFIACFCCQGCPLNKFYIRKRLSDGNVTCPSCRQRGHVPMVLSNENGLVATCASRDCQPMLLGPSGDGFAAPYPVCEAHRLGWNSTQGQPLTEINVIYPTDDPPPYRESYTDTERKPLHHQSNRCVPPLRSCYEPEAEAELSPRLTQNGTCSLADSAISSLTERGQHVLVDVVQEAFIAQPRRKREAQVRLHILADRSRHQSRERSEERERTLDRTTVV